MRRNILIVDDEPLVRDFLEEALRKNYQVDLADDAFTALSKIEGGRVYDIVVTDVRMPKMSGMDLLKRIKQISPHTEVIMITAYGDIDNAVEAMQRGACDYITKPFRVERLEAAMRRVFGRKGERDKGDYPVTELGSPGRVMVGRSRKMQELFSFIKSVAPSKATVLIEGESGTGKELVAHALHYYSSRQMGPFVKINCAALPEGLMESELFGYERGAFTGAVRRTKGKFELAHEGTLLLDEVSAMSPALQAKLLRVLQEWEFEPLGNRQTIRVDVRVVATTNRNLTEMVKTGDFREDLFYRLNVITIDLPPLRERKEDIPSLVDYFVGKYARENRKDIKGVSDEALEILTGYDWPGNVRELENSVERAVVIADDNILRPKHFRLGKDIFLRQEIKDEGLGLTLREAERRLILKTLEVCGGNRTRAARVLGISIRTLRNKLNEYWTQDHLLE